MPARLGTRLQAARNDLFVGRAEELRLFRDALAQDPFPFYVLHVFGPGGVGKTSLLRAFARLCQDHEATPYYLDGRDIDPEPEALLSALRGVLNVEDPIPPLEALADQPGRHVLLIDTYETIATLDGWLRDRFLPQVPENVLTVLAGRDLPAQAWRADPGWQTLVEVIPLRNLNAEEAAQFLFSRAVPEEQHQRVLDFTHGHPLATSLVADLLDQYPQQTFEPHQAPDVIKTLLEQFAQQVPGPAHRAALEACALVRFTTEASLRHLLDMPDVHDLFDWLRGLSFIDADARGLFPHDLAREVLAADLRWRNPDWHTDLHHRARQFYTGRLKQTGTHTDFDTLSDYTFLLREHPLVRPFFSRLRSQWHETDPIIADTPEESDWPLLVDMVEHHEGKDSAQIARHWFERQPEGVSVYRNNAGDLLGFMATLTLNDATPEARTADPATEVAWTYLEAQAPLRAGEKATMFRFWISRDDYQSISPVQSLMVLHRVRHYLNTPGLAYTFLPCRDADFWGMILTYGGMKRIAEADFDVGGQRYGVFGHDWRAVPPAAWLDLLAQRSLTLMPEEEPAPSQNQMLVLSRSGFEEALRNAFRDFARPDKLHGNPLLHSRIVIDAVGLGADDRARINALCTLIETTTEQLASNLRDAKYYRAVHRTYLRPAASQEQAAEQLDLPFSTFRRHLKRGLNRVTDILWEQELGNLSPRS